MSHEYEMFSFERSRGHMICDMPALILVTVKHFPLSSLNVNIFNCLSLYVELWCMEIIDNSRGIQHNSRFLLCRYAFGKKFISIFSVSKKTHISPERYILRLLNLLTVECPCKTISSCQTCFQKKTPLYGFTKPYSFHFPQKLSLKSLKKFHAPRNSFLKTWTSLLDSLNHPGTTLNLWVKPINLPSAGTTEIYF